MKSLCNIGAFIAAHQTLVVYILIAMAYSLPTPGDTRPIHQKLYSFFYDTARTLANRGKPAPVPPLTGEKNA